MSRETPIQPQLGALLACYLEKQADACAVGTMASPDEVTAYDAGPVQPIDAKLAWDEACAVFGLGGTACDTRSWIAPPAWPTLVAGHEPALALALCAANFPQLVRNFHLVLQTADLAGLKPQTGRSMPAPELVAWADDLADRQQFPQVLLALGTLRLAKQLDAAEAYARRYDAAIPAERRPGWANEKAALAWHAGHGEAALAAWRQLEPTVPVLFNRGMAELFLGQAIAARENLANAVARLPESTAWHHLGRLYLTLANR